MTTLQSQQPRRQAVTVSTVLLLVSVLLPGLLTGAEKVTLEESPNQAGAFQVNCRLTVKGQIETATGDGKAAALKLDVDATLKYRERRLPGAGRDAQALRSLRHYDRADAKIVVQQQTSSSRLRPSRRLIVAHGKREGVVTYSLDGAMNSSEIELLDLPGDSLAVLALLPRTPVEPGEKWMPGSWVIQMLTGADAVLESELSCELESVRKETATVTFAGKLEGATGGASTKITISGRYQFNLKLGYIERLELKQTEKRSVGAVSPGMDVTADVVLTRKPTGNSGPLDKKAIARVPLEPPADLMLVSYLSPWNVRFHYDRNWHVFHQTGQMVILRLLDKGSLIAQCNATRIAPALPGKHTSEQQFQRDIRKSLGDKLTAIVKAEEVKTDDGRFLYRVTAKGEANTVPMTWIYYLCADPQGRQVSFVFSVESKLIERMSNRDLGMVGSINFLTPKTVPAKALP